MTDCLYTAPHRRRIDELQPGNGGMVRGTCLWCMDAREFRGLEDVAGAVKAALVLSGTRVIKPEPLACKHCGKDYTNRSQRAAHERRCVA